MICIPRHGPESAICKSKLWRREFNCVRRAAFLCTCPYTMRNTKVQLALGLAICAVFLYLTLRPVKMSDLWSALVNL